MPDLEAAREALWRKHPELMAESRDNGLSESAVVDSMLHGALPEGMWYLLDLLRASERDRLANPGPELVKAVAHRIAAVEIRDYEPVGTPDAAHMEMTRAALQAAAKALDSGSAG